LAPIRDWYLVERPKIDDFSFADAYSASVEWHEQLAERLAEHAGETVPPGEIIHTWPDGFTLHRIGPGSESHIPHGLGWEHLVTAEGRSMQNCLAEGYYNDPIEEGKAVLLSLRSPAQPSGWSRPVVTMLWDRGITGIYEADDNLGLEWLSDDYTSLHEIEDRLRHHAESDTIRSVEGLYENWEEARDAVADGVEHEEELWANLDQLVTDSWRETMEESTVLEGAFSDWLGERFERTGYFSEETGFAEIKGRQNEPPALKHRDRVWEAIELWLKMQSMEHAQQEVLSNNIQEVFWVVPPDTEFFKAIHTGNQRWIVSGSKGTSPRELLGEERFLRARELAKESRPTILRHIVSFGDPELALLLPLVNTIQGETFSPSGALDLSKYLQRVSKDAEKRSLPPPEISRPEVLEVLLRPEGFLGDEYSNWAESAQLKYLIMYAQAGGDVPQSVLSKANRFADTALLYAQMQEVRGRKPSEETITAILEAPLSQSFPVGPGLGRFPANLASKSPGSPLSSLEEERQRLLMIWDYMREQRPHVFPDERLLQAVFQSDEFRRRWISEIAAQAKQRDPEDGLVPLYLPRVLGQGSPAAIQHLDRTRELIARGEPKWSFDFAVQIDRKPHPLTREGASRDPEMAVRYAEVVDQMPHEVTRRGASASQSGARAYAMEIDRGPHPVTRAGYDDPPEVHLWGSYESAIRGDSIGGSVVLTGSPVNQAMQVIRSQTWEGSWIEPEERPMVRKRLLEVLRNFQAEVDFGHTILEQLGLPPSQLLIFASQAKEGGFWNIHGNRLVHLGGRTIAHRRLLEDMHWNRTYKPSALIQIPKYWLPKESGLPPDIWWNRGWRGTATVHGDYLDLFRFREVGADLGSYGI